jgi:hypothetical protein
MYDTKKKFQLYTGTFCDIFNQPFTLGDAEANGAPVDDLNQLNTIEVGKTWHTSDNHNIKRVE